MTNPLHIAVDARWIFPEISGIGQYTQELIGALARSDSPHRFTLIFDNDDVLKRTASHTSFTANKNVTTRLVANGPYAPADQLQMPKLLKELGADIFHATNAMMPLWNMDGVKRIVTIHDLIPLLFRDYAPRSKKNRLFPVFKWLINQTAARADMIIAVSESTKRDIIKNLTIPEADHGKIRVVYEGVEPEYRPVRKPEREELEFLFVGRRDPYKNLPMLVEAFAAIKKDGLPASLRVIGSEDARYPEARNIAADLGVEDQIDWSGYVSDEELIRAIQTTDVYVHPSRYEGFGLPVLEAMACGTPVICSNTSSLPEVAGDAALLMDPSDTNSLIDAMKQLIQRSELRGELAQKGIAHAAGFSWAATAEQTLRAYSAATNP